MADVPGGRCHDGCPKELTIAKDTIAALQREADVEEASFYYCRDHAPEGAAPMVCSKCSGPACMIHHMTTGDA